MPKRMFYSFPSRVLGCNFPQKKSLSCKESPATLIRAGGVSAELARFLGLSASYHAKPRRGLAIAARKQTLICGEISFAYLLSV